MIDDAKKPTTNYKLPSTPPLIVVLGQTASGKSALAMKLALKYNGEIVCADSRTVYKGMNLGTAKPTRDDRRAVKHYLLDVVEPNEKFSVAEFKKLANDSINEINNKGKLPILVGGSGLYIDSILYDYKFRKSFNPSVRAELEKLSVKELQKIIIDKKLPLPNNSKNPRHLIRTIETDGELSQKSDIRHNTLIVGIKIEKDILAKRVNNRVHNMISDGFIDEIKSLLSSYDESIESFRAPGYKAFIRHVKGELTIKQATEEFTKADLRLAKRQSTWFKRNKSIQWVESENEGMRFVQNFLFNHQVSS